MASAVASVLCLCLGTVVSAVDLSKGFPFPPDTRPAHCPKYKKNDFANLTVSIIIPWLAEKWEHMEGTMKALLHFTPDVLVKEYIWISDGNKDSKEKELVALSPKVKVFAFSERQGLMLAKMKGVAMATGDVLVFMEAHCIPNKHWLQHILRRVVLNPRVLAMPTLDVIPQTNWHIYQPMSPGHWRYEWNFNLIHTNPAEISHHSSEPYTSPGTSGGIFAMRKDWFEELGLFDPGMREWGGDHMELTMKVWRCGGRIEIVPCSRVGHLYRDPEHRPYNVVVDTVVQNYKRLAELWAKDHLSYFYDET
jgi:polypeptide N-acetylgalactosaminyltransferase